MSGRRLLRRVLVANRGEIAVRVIRTCRRLGIETVLTVSEADALSLPARLADRVIGVGAAAATTSYLNVDAMAEAAVMVRADALHPGYGFLSENARLARACAAAGVVFIGPDPETLEATGDKLAAREHAIAAGLPVLPGGHVAVGIPDTGPGAIAATAGGSAIETSGVRHAAVSPAVPGRSAPRAGQGDRAGQAAKESRAAPAGGAPETAGELAGRIGYPVLVKAAGGGGGRGLRVVRGAAELEHAVAVASAEAAAAFGDPRVYLERYVERGRHVEVQLLGDGDSVIHLGDRDCSVQRRYQKLIEEAPAPGLDAGLRDRLRAAAVALGRHLRYRGAGTVEFLVDAERGEFYFLEVNVRIQVEHPVTEAITGIDIVAEQLAIAEGRPLRLTQGDVTFAGHAIEVRVNAEDPERDFLPSPGVVTRAVFPATTLTVTTPTALGLGGAAGQVRVDTHLQAGSAVPPHYDSLLAKVIARGADRADALNALGGALDRCRIEGVTTNLGLQRAVLADAEFAAGGVDTGYLARLLERGPLGGEQDEGGLADVGPGAGGPAGGMVPAGDRRAGGRQDDAPGGADHAVTVYGGRSESAEPVLDDRDGDAGAGRG